MTREEAITVLEDIIAFESFGNKATCDACKMAIEALKQPERIKAKWIDARDYCGEFLCSNCHETNIHKSYHYCPYCGAELEGEQ